MSLLDTVISLKAVEFNVLLGLFPPIEGSSVTLLQHDGTVKNFKPTDNRPPMTEGWRTVTNRYQQTRELQIATTEPDFWKVIGRSSHLAIGTHVFEIERGSLMPPSDRHPYYTIKISATGETYV
ncbi:MAG: hypothetical protein ACK4S4_15810 [Pyrinomonadaceae bacterium]